MIKTPVKLHSIWQLNLVGKDGMILEYKEMSEAVKRINMHDELVAALKHIQCLVLLPKDIADNVNKLLEKCNGQIKRRF